MQAASRSLAPPVDPPCRQILRPLASGIYKAWAMIFIAADGSREAVPSPTFTLVQLYERGDATIWHFDCYRLRDPEEAWELGIEDAFHDGISLIEWPERLGALLPARRLEITLLPGPSPTARRALIDPGDDPIAGWEARLAGLAAEI